MRPTMLAAALAALFLATPAAAQDEPTERDTACLAEAVYYEARGTSDRSRAAVAHVVLNRTEHDEFPDDVCGVIADRCQFSYRCNGRPERLADPADRAEAFRTAEAVLTGAAPDPTGGALFFHAARIGPGWFNTRPRVAEIGGHIFYR
jgi:N-acetylmuramoyl-L-alanine amidase